MLHDQLKELKNRKNLTAQEIADRSGVPLSTVNKILSGQTDNPAFLAYDLFSPNVGWIRG